MERKNILESGIVSKLETFESMLNSLCYLGEVEVTDILRITDIDRALWHKKGVVDV